MITNDIHSSRVLVAPLNWGLGHASRCIPLIRELLKNSNTVILASSGESLKLLQDTFPISKAFSLPDYRITYGKNSLALSIFTQIPDILDAIKQEHKETIDIVENNKIDYIISDNRYGVWTEKTRNICITHQLKLMVPHPFRALAKLLNERMLSRFDEIWVPDYEGTPNLSGALSHCKFNHKSIRFIGPLTRFENMYILPEKEFDALFILSGPEPQRSIFETKIIAETQKFPDKKFVLVRGTTEQTNEFIPDYTSRHYHANLKIYDRLHELELLDLFIKARLVISRSGYSSLMDYHALGINAVIVPTPGQAEQEYLAHFHSKSGKYRVQMQKTFSLNGIL